MEVTVNDTPYYGLSLKFIHPLIDPADITALLDIEPRYAWKAGEQAKTPIGTILNFKRKESYWCYSTYTDQRLFFIEINQIITYLSPHKDFLHRIVAEGGRVQIDVGLLGSVNIGDTISLETLAKLVDLKIHLGIEVFPHMKRQEPM